MKKGREWLDIPPMRFLISDDLEEGLSEGLGAIYTELTLQREYGTD